MTESQINNIEIAKMLGYTETTTEFKMKWLGVRSEQEQDYMGKITIDGRQHLPLSKEYWLPESNGSNLAKFDEDKIPYLEKDNDFLFIEYDTDWNKLMDAISYINKTHNEGILKRDLTYTISYLLNGGFKYGRDISDPWLPMTLENLFIRVAQFAKYHNSKNR